MKLRHALLALATIACAPAGDDVEDTDTDAAETDDTDLVETDDTDVETDDTEDTDCEVDACGTCDDDPTNDCVTSWEETDGAWDCTNDLACVDRYAFTVADDTTLTVVVSDLAGDSVVSLGLRADPNDGGTNLINGDAPDHLCKGQDEPVEVTVTVAEGGTYTLAVVRDWLQSSGDSGTYRVSVTADPGLVFEGRTADDDVSGTTGSCLL